MHIDSAEGLVAAYGAASADTREAVNVLSPLVTEAYDLLGTGSQNGLYGPIPALVNLANDLRTEQDDVTWRVDWLKSTDALPLGLSGRVQGEVPVDLDAAFRASGLTAEQIELANEMMRDGVSFADAVAAAQSDDPQAALEAMRLAELNDAIENWNGTDNDPILDQLLRERRRLVDEHLDGSEPIAPPVLGQLLVTVSPEQLLEAERNNPGTIDIGLLHAIVADHDATFYPGDPTDPFVENARDTRDLLVADLAGDIDGRPDPVTAAIAQRNGITFEEAEFALQVNEIDRLNDQAASIPSPQGAAVAREQRDQMILDFVDGDVVIAASIGRFMTQGHDLATASELAVEQREAQVLAAYNAANADASETVEEDRGFWGNIKHNVLDGGSVVGAFVTQDPVGMTQAVVEHGPGIASTVENAVSEISSLDPTSPEGIALLLSDPEQFASNWANFGGGVVDFTVDTGKLVGALAIAGNPALNLQVETFTGRNIRQEVNDALIGAAQFAAADPDAFVASIVNWEQLEDDPIRWAGQAAPEVVIEVLTGGGAAGGIAGRRAANTVADIADTATDANAARRAADNTPPPPNSAAIAADLNPPISDNLGRIDSLNLERIEIDTILISDTSRVAGTPDLRAPRGSLADINQVGGSYNCVNCAIATDAQLAGFPARALGKDVPKPGQSISILSDHFESSWGPGYPSIDPVLTQVERADDGARGIIYVAKRGGRDGHVLNIQNQGGRVVLLDGQRGSARTVKELSEKYRLFSLLWTNQ